MLHNKVIQFTVIAIATLCISYIAVLTHSYGLSDDYRHLYRAVSNDNHFPENIIVQGRPLYAFLLDVTFSEIGTINKLSIARAISLLGIIGCGIMLYLAYQRRNNHHLTSSCLALITVLTPAFGVYAAWAATFHAPYAALLAMISACMLLSDKRRVLLAVVSTLLLVAALQLYQPAAMMFWVYCAIILWGSGTINPSGQKKLIKAVIVFCAASVIFYITHKLTVAYFLQQDEFFKQAAGRSSLATDPWHKLQWFIKEPLMAAMNVIYITEHRGRMVALAALLVIGAIMHEIKAPKESVTKRMIYWGIMLGLAIGSFLPNMIIKLDIEVFRTLPALYAMVIFLSYIALKEVTQNNKWIINTTVIICFISAITVSRQQVGQYIVSPSVKEYQALKNELTLQAEKLETLSTIYVLLPNNQITVEKGVYEYGESANIAMPWVTKGMVWLVARETLGRKVSEALQVQRIAAPNINNESNAVTLNIPEIYGSM